MALLVDMEELKSLTSPRHTIRIPNQIDIPVTARILRIIDAPSFQRLKKISQLGLVSTVYPAATHSRFEHSLGVYRTALLFLNHFATNDRFAGQVSRRQAEAFVLASLLHDIGHWPYCHPIEDMRLTGIPKHEDYSQQYLLDPEIADCIAGEFSCSVDDVVKLIQGDKTDPDTALIRSLLSGPIDVDKMDYLYRDSLHAGVPYGQNFDSGRLIDSLIINRTGDRLAITEKGRTAAELMVFARYVMFSEVYWHHAARSATAMLQRAFYRTHLNASHGGDAAPDYSGWFRQGDAEFVQTWQSVAPADARRLLEGLFGPTRKLFKRVANYSCFESESIFRGLAHRPYRQLVEIGSRLANEISHRHTIELKEDDVLIDAPPVGLEVQFNVDVYYKRSGSYLQLGDVSPVVSTLATRQFDDYVKQVRVFVAPEKAAALKGVDLTDAVKSVIVASETSGTRP